MPWRISHRDDEYCVIKETDNSVVKCHPTEKEAKAHMRALYANVEDADLNEMPGLIASIRNRRQHKS